MEEILRDIKGLEGKYKASNCGNIYSSFIKSTKQKGSIYGGDYKSISLVKNKNGYLSVMLLINNTRKKVYVHRIIASTFLPNVNNEPVINHKDGNRKNNNVNNLEWCSHSENNLHAFRVLNKKPTFLGCFSDMNPNHKVIKQYDCNFNLIKLWKCEADAERKLGISKTNISACCHYRRKTTGGYIWRFANE